MSLAHLSGEVPTRRASRSALGTQGGLVAEEQSDICLEGIVYRWRGSFHVCETVICILDVSMDMSRRGRLRTQEVLY